MLEGSTSDVVKGVTYIQVQYHSVILVYRCRRLSWSARTICVAFDLSALISSSGCFFFFGMLRVVLVLVLPMGMSPYT